jgi:hypothetical protein
LPKEFASSATAKVTRFGHVTIPHLLGRLCYCQCFVVPNQTAAKSNGGKSNGGRRNSARRE